MEAQLPARRTYGRYEALHLIASGGMASVYLGRTRGAGGFERLVALKVMHEHIAHDPAFSGMFLDEARLAAKIRHPNVVPTLDVADDGSYIVMEYVEGASLHAILSRRRKKGEGPLPLPVALRIFIDALTGLHAAHELCDRRDRPLNIVHRDVSPHNILVGVDGTSRITDFGIAFAEARITSTRGGQLKGKLPYMAPEQLEDEPVDRRTDVYAAGCVLWEILTGERLFRGSNEAAIACAVLAGPERTPSEINPGVPEELDAACMMALRRREGRFMTAIAFADAVEAAADGAGIRIAKHRKIGAYAKEGQTYPAPASIISSGNAAATAQEAPETRRIEEREAEAEPLPPTRRIVGPADGAAEGEPSPASLELPQRSTLVSSDSVPATARPSSKEGEWTDESGGADLPLVSSVAGLPTKRRGGTAWVVALAAVAVVLAVWLLTRDGPVPQESPAQTAQPSSDPSGVTASSAPETASALPAQSAERTASRVADDPPILEARPAATPAGEPPAPRPPAPKQVAPPPEPKPVTKPAPDGYHPSTP